MPEFNPGGAANLNEATKLRLVANADTNVLTNAQLAQLLASAPLASPTFTGIPTAPTAAAVTDTAQLATTAFVQAAVAALIAAAPGALNTLDELAAALGDDANFAATVTTALAGKQGLHANLTTLAGLVLIADRLPYANGTGTLALTTFTAAGRALIDDADASAQLTTLGVSTFVKTILDDANAAAALTTLGISAFAQTLLDDTTAAAVMTTLGISAFAQTLLDDANAAASLTTLGAAPLASPTFTGTPAAPTAAAATNTTQLATTAFVQAAVAALINSAPGALDTLDELAAALGDDANFAATVTTALAGKQALHANLTALAGLTLIADRLPYANGTGTLALATLTAAGRALLDDADAAAQLTTLGVSTFAKTILDDADAAAVRTTLGMVAASSAEIRAATEAVKQIAPAGLLAATASVSLTDGATITPDFSAGRNFNVTLAGNRTLANPTNQAAGQSGRILIKQDATGTRTLAYGANWLFPGGDPTLSTAANAVDMICYDVQASGEIYATILKAFS